MSNRSKRGPQSITGDQGDLDDEQWLALWKPTHGAYVWCHWLRVSPIAAALRANGMDPKHRIVWDKGHWGPGNLNQYGSQTEDCVVWLPSDYKIPWVKREGNVWRAGPRADRVGHPTQKPLGVIVPAIQHTCPEGGIVADPFGGSGTTIIATEQVGGGRRCVAVELDPKFCALTLERVRRLGFEIIRLDTAPAMCQPAADKETTP